MAYEVQTPVFEGPLDVLLHLITRQQVELYEISISKIVNGFLEHMDAVQQANFDLELTTEFLLIAATLVELKARRLLPGNADVDLDEELALWEERDLLLARLVECKTFKDAALCLVAMEDAAARSYPRRAGIEERFADIAPDLLTGVTPEKLRKAFLKVATPKPVPKVTLDHVGHVKVTVQQAMEELLATLPRLRRVTFRRLTATYSDRMEVIVRFLGLLELYKQGVVDLEQPSTFGELEITWTGDGDGDGDGAGNGDGRGVAGMVIDLRESALAHAYEG